MNIISKVFFEARVVIFFLVHRKQVTVGKRLSVRRNFFVKLNKETHLIIGNNCFFYNDCSLNVMEWLSVGDNCLFGENVKVYDHEHELGIPFRNQGFTTEPVIIGNNCWIGSNTVILKGVHIGSNVVVGAGTLITKDLPDNSVVYQARKLTIKLKSRL